MCPCPVLHECNRIMNNNMPSSSHLLSGTLQNAFGKSNSAFSLQGNANLGIKPNVYCIYLQVRTENCSWKCFSIEITFSNHTNTCLLYMQDWSRVSEEIFNSSIRGRYGPKQYKNTLPCS